MRDAVDYLMNKALIARACITERAGRVELLRNGNQHTVVIHHQRHEGPRLAARMIKKTDGVVSVLSRRISCDA